jgi:leader peptidase (prepilin peptidase)/N-methyltransferase
MDRTQELVWFYYLVAAGFGLVFGSFFNVVIYRLPNEMSLGQRSRCPLCGMTIRWYDNVPILSYVVLRGRCRGCRAPISIRYPLIEAGTAGLFVLMYWWSRSVVPSELGLPAPKIVSPELFIGLLMVSILMIVSVVDITHGIVPNRVIYPGLVMMFLLPGLIYGFIFMRREPPGEGVSAAGASQSKQAVSDEEDEDGIPTGIGMGDIKLIAFTGLALGYFHWYLIIVQIFAGFLIGALASIPLLILAGKGRKDRLAFAPFLAAGAVVALVWGQQLADLYLKLLR